MKRFIMEKDKNGQSQCYNCGTISWHTLMYRDTSCNKMICDKCKELYELSPMLGKEIIELRERVQKDDRYPNPKYYNIAIQPDKYYIASIIDEDISELTSIYIEEFIYEKEV